MHKERILESSTSPSVSTTVDVPVGWPAFSLTKFFSMLEQQAFATFVNRADDIKPILLFEEAFSARMPEIFHGGGRDEHLAMVLFARMLSAQTGAARLLFAGQIYEAQALLRSAIECGVYGCLVRYDADLRQTWYDRGKSNSARARCREAFAWGGLMNMLDARSRDVRRLIKPVYEKLIDMGAHPNSDGVGASIRLESASGGAHILSTVFSSAEVAPFRAAVRQHIGVLHIGFELVRLAAPERVERVGVTPQVNEILSSVGVLVLSSPAH